MSIERGRAYFRALGLEDRVQEFEVSSATVELAALALGVEGARIAKTLSFKTAEGGCMLILAAGDARIDNPKFKAKFHLKAKMLTPEEVLGQGCGDLGILFMETTPVEYKCYCSRERMEAVTSGTGSSPVAARRDRTPSTTQC